MFHLNVIFHLFETRSLIVQVGFEVEDGLLIFLCLPPS